MDRYIGKFQEIPPKVSVVLSYVICINTCAFARNSLKIILWYIFRTFYQNHWLIIFFNSIAYAIMFLCGCLTGFLIHKNSVFHSSVAVALGVAFTYLVSGINQNEYILLLEGVLTGAVLGGVGGGGALIIRNFLCSK